MRKGAWIKFAALVGFLATTVVIVHIVGGIDALEFEVMQTRVEQAGAWAPLAYVAIYVFGTVATIPGTLLTVLGAALFPLGWAYLLVLVGATAGASLSFAVARALGREVVEQTLATAEGQMAEKLRAWTGRVERNGVLAIAYLRMAYVPFPILNYAAPLTGVRFRDFVVGTVLGILPGAFVFVFMGNTLRAAWEQGSVDGLVGWQVGISVLLFIISLSLPIVLQRRWGDANKAE